MINFYFQDIWNWTGMEKDFDYDYEYIFKIRLLGLRDSCTLLEFYSTGRN